VLQASEDVLDPTRSSSLGSSSQQLLAPSSPPQQQQQPSAPPRTAVVAAAAAAPGASLVQEQGGASLLQLVAAWDQLASRLPPEAGAGRASEVILNALKLAVAYAPAAPASSSSSSGQPQLARPVARALSLASHLADLAAAGLPIDAESIAAGILAEVLLAGAHPASPAASAGAAPWHPSDTLASSSSSSSSGASSSGGSGAGGSAGVLTLAVIEERAGPIIAQLVHDVQRARQLPSRVELLDDTAAAALRELCLSFYDVRATAVEVVARLDALTTPGALPSYEQQVAALEALQMYAPMGHALGLSAVAAQLEDRCFQVGGWVGGWVGGCCSRSLPAWDACLPGCLPGLGCLRCGAYCRHATRHHSHSTTHHTTPHLPFSFPPCLPATATATACCPADSVPRELPAHRGLAAGAGRLQRRRAGAVHRPPGGCRGAGPALC
jgi:hypothetical protein